MLRFHSPYFFLLLIPLILLVFLLQWKRRPASVLFSDITILKALPKTFFAQTSTLVPWILYMGIGLLIVALARPQSGKEEYRIRSEGIALAMCVDRSGSMAAVDFLIDGKRVNRLEAVRKTFRDFVAGNVHRGGNLAGRRDDMIGLLAFGGYVDAYCPLTLDHATLLELLNEVQIPKAYIDDSGRIIDRRLYEEENMTAIGDAIAQAVDRLKNVKAKSKVIILLSDGEQTFGTLEPLEAAQLAKTFGIKIYTIGIGSTGLVPYIVTDQFGQERMTNQYMVIDESTLQNIADLTDGKYFNAKNTQALDRIYSEIDKLEKTVHEGRVYTRYTELFRFPLLVGMALILLYILLINTRYRRLP